VRTGWKSAGFGSEAPEPRTPEEAKAPHRLPLIGAGPHKKRGEAVRLAPLCCPPWRCQAARRSGTALVSSSLSAPPQSAVSFAAASGSGA